MKHAILNIGTVLSLLGGAVMSFQLWNDRPADKVPIRSSPRLVDQWAGIAGHGQTIGAVNGGVRIVEFSDFQCPYCAAIQPGLRRLLDKYTGNLTLEYRHFPIVRVHPYAMEAAMAVECAADQGKFQALHDTLFAAQGDIGTRSWASFAKAAGVRDIPRLQGCIDHGTYKSRIQNDVAAALDVRITATPSFIVDGYVPGGPATAATLDSLVADAIERRRRK